jgi:hypothetical protein
MSDPVAMKWFERLIPLLKDRKLPCELGPARECHVDEFMFMHENSGVGYFKHSDTRNYIRVMPYNAKDRAFASPNESGYELFVPFSTDAFQRGFFDRL